ncbi:MAG: murein biosynthesis integral membrane protein MurJ [Devosiaceae bacterium]|nr:murein biosynthesis integral membrane protein MurJ [Devosiaceae bacterium]
MSLYKNFFNVSAMTLISRVLGFVRDILIALVLGTGMVADAFFAAFRFPNLFRRLFAEGAFNSAFIPLFASKLEEKTNEEARLFASHIISWLAVFLLIITILAEIFMPQLMAIFVPGFVADKEKFEFTVLLARICFPYLAAMSLMAAYGGILNGLGKFLAAAFAPVLLNIVLVIILIFLVFSVEAGAQIAGIWLAIGIFIGGIAQFILVFWAVKRTGFLPKFSRPKINPDVRKFWLLAIPAIFTGGITQINIFIGTIIASSASAAISYLYFADRLYQLPLGLIGIAIGVVLLPELSRHISGGRNIEAKKTMDNSLLFAMVLTLPATAGLITLAHPIIRTLFERGAFDAIATSNTANALIAFSFGLPAFVLIKLLQPQFFARKNTKTPTIFAAISVIVNIAVSLLLFPYIQHIGIAIATSVSAWINVIMLTFTLKSRNHFALSFEQIKQQGFLLLSAIIMGATIFGLSFLLNAPLLGNFGFLMQILSLFAIIIAGIFVYFTLIDFTNILRSKNILSFVKRRNK